MPVLNFMEPALESLERLLCKRTQDLAADLKPDIILLGCHKKIPHRKSHTS